MSIRILMIISTSLLIFLSAAAVAGERMIAGSERGSDLVATGAADALTSPARVLTEIRDETRNFGAFGIIGGSVRGPIKAGGQALRGGARMAIGILDVLLSPFVEPEPE